MDDRIDQEIKLLKQEYPNLVFKEEALWISIPDYQIPEGIWNKSNVTLCFQVPAGYPGNPPYGFFVEGGLRVKDTDDKPDSYEEPAQTPFEGVWGKFSWAHDDSWRATANLMSGGNLLNFVRTFKDRLKEGK